MSTWFEEGKPISAVPVDDRAFQYGDGLFETIAVRDGSLRLFDRHMTRLQKGCAKLRLEIADEKTMRHQIEQALADTPYETSNCVAKVIVSAGTGQRGYGRLTTRGTVRIGIFTHRTVASAAYASGVTAIVCDTRLAVPSVTAGLKTVARLEQVMGRSECLRADVFEGLMLDADGRVICGTMSNVFIVSGESLLTPFLGRCGVAGVMREFAIDVFQKHGIDVSIRDVEVDELMRNDEVFLTNSQFGALPLRACAGREFVQGSMSRGCFELLARHGIVECAQ